MAAFVGIRTPDHPPLPLLRCLPEDDPAPEVLEQTTPFGSALDPAQRLRRIRISSLFCAALELAKEGAAHLAQHDAGPLLSARSQNAEAA